MQMQVAGREVNSDPHATKRHQTGRILAWFKVTAAFLFEHKI